MVLGVSFRQFCVVFGSLLDHFGSLWSHFWTIWGSLGPLGHHWGSQVGAFEDQVGFWSNSGPKSSPQMDHFWHNFRRFADVGRVFEGLFFEWLLEPPLDGPMWLPIGNCHIGMRFPMLAKSQILDHFWVTFWIILGHVGDFGSKKGASKKGWKNRVQKVMRLVHEMGVWVP